MKDLPKHLFEQRLNSLESVRTKPKEKRYKSMILVSRSYSIILIYNEIIHILTWWLTVQKMSQFPLEK